MVYHNRKGINSHIVRRIGMDEVLGCWEEAVAVVVGDDAAADDGVVEEAAVEAV